VSISRHNLLIQRLAWLCVALCFVETGLRAHAYCVLLGCRSKHAAEIHEGSRLASESPTASSGCQHRVCLDEKLSTDTDNLTHLGPTAGEGMPDFPCPRNCWCRQSPQPQVLTDTTAWTQLQQQRVPSTAVAMPADAENAAVRSVLSVAPASLATSTDLCATLCRFLA